MSRSEMLQAVKSGKLSPETAAKLEHAQCVIRKAGLAPDRKNVLRAFAQGAVTATAVNRLFAAEHAVSAELAAV